ncbi:hypothetical protein [Leptobacterium sp. I13]
MMYWPIILNDRGASEKEISGKKKSGKNVKAMWVNAMITTVFSEMIL